MLEIVRQYPDRYRVVAMAAGTRVDVLARRALEFKPDLLSVADDERAGQLKRLLPDTFKTKIVSGTEV